MTSNLKKRLFEHRTKIVTGFTANYAVTQLVYFECFENIHAALSREKQIKGYRREKKVRLIESSNAGWRDLADGWFDGAGAEHEPPGKTVPPRRCAPRSG